MALRCRNGIMNARPSPDRHGWISNASYPERDRRKTIRCPRNRESRCLHQTGMFGKASPVIRRDVDGKCSGGFGLGGACDIIIYNM